MLLPHERKQAREFGYSLDTKLMNDEFFYIDLEKMWFCLSIAILRQIQFSRGFLFLDDLAEYLKNAGSGEKFPNPNDLSASENELRFSYQFPDVLKLNQIEAFKSLYMNGNRSSEETWNIKRAIDMDEEDKKWVFPEINGKANSIENLEAFLQKEGYLINNSNKSSNKESPIQHKSLLPRSNGLEEAILNRNNKFWNKIELPEETDELIYEDDLVKEKESDNKFEFQFKNESKFPSKFNSLTL